jgi:hypothetical protein
MGGTLRTQNFKILSVPLSFKYKIAEQKCKIFFFFKRKERMRDFLDGLGLLGVLLEC